MSDDRDVVTITLFVGMLLAMVAFGLLIYKVESETRPIQVVTDEIETNIPLPKGDHNVTVNRSDFTYSW